MIWKRRSFIAVKVVELELLANDEVRLPSTGCSAIRHRIEAIGNVHSHQTKHRHEDAQTNSSTTLQVKRTVVPEIVIIVSSFQERQWEYLSRRVVGEDVSEFKDVFIVQRTTSNWGNGVVLVPAKTDDLAAIDYEIGQTITSYIEAFERRQAQIFVVRTEVSKFPMGADDELRGDRCKPICIQLPFVVFHQSEALLAAQALVINVLVEHAKRRGQFCREAQLRTARRENGYVGVITS